VERDVVDVLVRHGLEPDRPPRPVRARVPDVVRAALLALRLAERVVVGVERLDDELVHASRLEVPGIEREVRVAALVRAERLAVEVYRRTPVDRAEADQRALA